MFAKIKSLFLSLGRFVRRHVRWFVALAIVGAVLVVAFILISYFSIDTYRKYIVRPTDTATLEELKQPVGMVLGAGVNADGKPYKELQARLDVAAYALSKGQVRKLILSGDNRFLNYNEPQAMMDYLIEVKHVSRSKLQPDYAGRSTYESCQRARDIFGLEYRRLVLFSAASHLPRAIFLCRHFGIEAYGMSSNLEANNAGRHELIARPKAIFNAYIYGEQTLGGDSIRL